MPVQTQIQNRRGTASSWASTNPVLDSGEMGEETDTNFFKIGDGVLTWNELPYASPYSANFPFLMGQGLTYEINILLANAVQFVVSAGTSFTTINPLFIPTRTRIDQFSFLRFGGTGTYSMGIYSNLNGKPDALIYDFGTQTDSNTTFNFDITLNPGLYWPVTRIENTTSGNYFRNTPYFPYGVQLGGDSVSAYTCFNLTVPTTTLPSSASAATYSTIGLSLRYRVF